MQKITIGVKDAAALIGVSHWAVRRWIKAGILPAVKLGTRLLVEPAELTKLVEHGRTGGSNALPNG